MTDDSPLTDPGDMDLDALTADLDNEAMGASDEDAVHRIVSSLVAEVRRLRGTRDDLRAGLATAETRLAELEAERVRVADSYNRLVAKLAVTRRRANGAEDALRALSSVVVSLPSLRPEPDEDPNGYSEGATYAYYNGRTEGRNDLREEFLDELADVLKTADSEPEEPTR